MDNALVGLLSLFVLIGLNAFFVFAEYGLAVSRRTRITELVARGNARAKVVEETMRDPDRFFAATQIGITLTSLAIGAISEPALSFMFERLFGVTSLSREVTRLIGAALALLVASFFQIVLAELVPRSYTLRNAERVALVFVPPMSVLASLLRPFAMLLKAASRLVLRVLRVNTSAEYERIHSAAELRMLVEESEKGGAIEPGQGDLLSAAFSFGDTTVREAMVPRTEMVAVGANALLADIVRAFTHHSVTRVAVFAESLDNIIGMLYLKDVLPAAYNNVRNISARNLMRPHVLAVPDTQRADEMLAQMRARHENIAIVLDEYGGTAGVVTLNDLLSRLVGEIGDAALPRTPDIQTSPDGTARINGLTTLGDVNEKFSLALTDENYDTIGGFVMGRLGRIPAVGDEVTIDVRGSTLSNEASPGARPHGARLLVEEMDGRRVAALKLIPDPPASN